MSAMKIKERVIRIIAATRFPFVDQTDWPDDYVTITNETEKRQGIDSPEGVVYPSIVIVDGEDRIREVGEVETEETDGSPIAQVEAHVREDGDGEENEEVLPLCPGGQRRVG